jgi:hypothetical protein
MAAMTDCLVYVLLKGKQEPIAVEGDDAQETQTAVEVIESGRIVARFDKEQVQGWWKQHA